METMPNDYLWSISEFCDVDLNTRLSAYVNAIANQDPSAGPADNAQRDGLPLRVMNGIAVIPIMGPMIRRGGMIARMLGLAGTDGIRLAVESALADESVNEILLRVDSPGGSVSGIDQLGDVLNAAEKPITAIVEGTAASAAYHVASQADQIFVGKTDLIGSIGVRMLLFDTSKAFEQEGIEPVVIDTGEFKSAGAPGTEITEAQRAEFQRIVNFYFDDFVGAVARGRNMTEQAVMDIADGRMFTPEQAMEIGLIDGISTLEKVLGEMRGRTQSRRTDSARARMRLVNTNE